jgi:hypothetical protein
VSLIRDGWKEKELALEWLVFGRGEIQCFLGFGSGSQSQVSALYFMVRLLFSKGF